jgi:hypothetical protein
MTVSVSSQPRYCVERAPFKEKSNKCCVPATTEYLGRSGSTGDARPRRWNRPLPMKQLFLAAALLGGALSAHGQQAAQRPYEAGVDAGSYVHVPLESDARTKLHGPSGIFFRYTPPNFFSGRVGLRAGAGFNRRVSGPPASGADFPEGETTARALTLRVGGQYAPLRRLPWLYAFADGAYRYTRTSGDYTGGLCGCLDYTETRTGHGWGTQVGLGATIGLLARFAVLPELYYENLFTRTTDVYADRRVGYTAARMARSRSNTPAFRVLATVSF